VPHTGQFDGVPQLVRNTNNTVRRNVRRIRALIPIPSLLFSFMLACS
jgi:hypothetical protein